METFAERLTALRRKQGLTISDLSRMIDVAVTTIYAWENGKRKPSRASLRKLAIALSMSARELEFGDDTSAVLKAIEAGKKLVAAAAGVPVDKVTIRIKP